MNITFKELRKIKHSLPTGSIKQIASALSLEEQTVRNYFGAQKYSQGKLTGRHLQPGPDGGIVNLKDTTILEMARKMITQSRQNAALQAD